MPPHVFALDEGRIRYGSFVAGEVGYELRSYESVELPPDVFLEGPMGGPAKEASVLREAVAALIARAPEPPAQASLVLTDDWLRVTFTEMEKLPRGAREREDTLRWKLQRLVPFRVEELRVSATEVSGADRNGGQTRWLLGFAVAAFLEQLEAVFADQGVRLGQITNESASLLAATRPLLRDVELGVVAATSDTSYGLVFTYRDEPVLYRRKSLAGSAGSVVEVGGLVLKDLRLTRAFVGDQFGDTRTGRVLLVGPEEGREVWSEWLSQALDLPVFPVGREQLQLRPWPGATEAHELASMFGAAQQVVD